MRRRDFIKVVTGSAVALPFAARAERTSRVPTIGVLWHAASADEEDVYLSVLRKAFNDLGYIEGQNVVFEHRFPAENPDRFQTLARELVDAKPDAIIAVTVLGAVALQKFTSTIPIVFVLIPDPLGLGLVKSLGRPGGNATGLSLMSMDLSGKRLALLREAVPNLSRVALLLGATDPFRERTIANHQAAARILGISLWSAEISEPDNVEPVFAKIAGDRADGIVRGTGADLFPLRARIGASAMAHRLPGITFIGEELSYGLLISYGQDFPEFFRRAAAYVDKILKGADPADLPVEQPTKFKLALNFKTAKAFGLTFPQTLITSADEVVE